MVQLDLGFFIHVYLGHPVLRRDPLWACRLFFSPFPPSAAEYGILGDQTQ